MSTIITAKKIQPTEDASFFLIPLWSFGEVKDLGRQSAGTEKRGGDKSEKRRERERERVGGFSPSYSPFEIGFDEAFL